MNVHAVKCNKNSVIITSYYWWESLTGFGSRELACYWKLPSMLIVNYGRSILGDPMNLSLIDSLEFIGPQSIEDDKLTVFGLGNKCHIFRLKFCWNNRHFVQSNLSNTDFKALSGFYILTF